MTTKKTERPSFSTILITPTFRLSYPHVWQKSFNQLAKREEYSILMMFDKLTDKAALQPMIKLVNDMIAWKWGSAEGVKKPFVDGDTKADKNPENKGKILVRSWTLNAPGVVDMTGKHPITQQDEIYGGCYCRAQVNAYCYPPDDKPGIGRGVNFGLIHIQKIKDGDPFGNRTRAEDAFAPVEGAVSSDAGGMFD